MTILRQDMIALDRAASARTIDSDGHMRVVGSAVSKANVCPYLAEEIPGWQDLNLQAGKIYRLYRDPAELKAAAASLTGKPLLIVHKAQTAADHDHELVVGALDNARWEAPYLRADLTIWDQTAIDLVQSGAQQQLSCAYRYQPVIQSGTSTEGDAFDGIMTDIQMNHCALVETGRAGADVVVGDAAIINSEKFIMMAKSADLSRTALFAAGSLQAYLRPKLAKDAKIDLSTIVAGVTAKTWKADKPKLKLAMDAATAGKLAKDSTLSDLDEILDDVQAAINDLADEPEDDTAEDEAETPDEKKARMEKRAADKTAKDKAAKDAEPDADKDRDADKKKDKPAMDTVTKQAMDAAIEAAVKANEKKVRADMRAIQTAQDVARPFIGDVIAQDSAAEIYKMVLTGAGVDVTGVHESALPAMVGLLPRPGSTGGAPRIAQDAAAGAEADFFKKYPTAGRLIRT